MSTHGFSWKATHLFGARSPRFFVELEPAQASDHVRRLSEILHESLQDYGQDQSGVAEHLGLMLRTLRDNVLPAETPNGSVHGSHDEPGPTLRERNTQ